MRDSLRLYVHVPFCERKCPYCHFYSLPISDRELIHEYIRALIRELDLWLWEYPELYDRRIVSVYLGGGTPSRLKLENLWYLISSLNDRFRLAMGTEVTLEANPQDLSLDYLKGLREIGFNRISIGVQTFSLFGLRLLGRPYDPSDALRAIELAFESGFSNVSVDLIFGYPLERVETLIRDISYVCSTSVKHVSTYELELEGSRMRSWHFSLSPHIEDMWDLIPKLLEGCGFRRYEVSNYARPGYESRHNIGYWRFEDWLALGPSATSKLTLYTGTYRLQRKPSLSEYLKLSELRAGLQVESLTPEEELWERLVMGLRWIGGVDLKCLAASQYQLLSLLTEPFITSGELVRLGDRLSVSPSALSRVHSILLELRERWERLTI